jgi:hypothetical protein
MTVSEPRRAGLPFSWKFTASDRHDLMDPISRHEQQDNPQDNRYRKPHHNPDELPGPPTKATPWRRTAR